MIFVFISIIKSILIGYSLVGAGLGSGGAGGETGLGSGGGTIVGVSKFFK
jgi:hypothetical protein